MGNEGNEGNEASLALRGRRGVEALRCGFQEAFPPAAADPEHAGVSFPIPHSRFRPSRLRPLPLVVFPLQDPPGDRSEEHTSELQSLMRISYAFFCLKQQNRQTRPNKSS